jgi:DNA-binding response OmpR family regulator
MTAIVLVDPELENCDLLEARLRELGVALEAYAEPLRAVARLGRRRADAVVLAARLGATTSARLVEVVRDELSLPVLLAHDAADVDIIGPAVLAGARPLVRIPYDPAEIVGALRQVRSTPTLPALVRVGELVLDPAGYDAQLGGRGVDLSMLEFDVLLELAVHHDHVVQRSSLMRRWTTSSDPEEKLVTVIGRLRRKLEAFGRAQASTPCVASGTGSSRTRSARTTTPAQERPGRTPDARPGRV